MVEARHLRRSLAIARAIGEHLPLSPDSVIAHGIANLPLLRDHVSGGATRYVDDWERLLVHRDVEAIQAVLSDETSYGSEMRTSTPFAGVLSDDEYLLALRAARL